MTLIIGLTGSIGTGKSTIANKFRELSIPVVDADLIARQVVEPGEDTYNKIIATFGNDIVQKDTTLDRKMLGSIVFSDEAKRKQLNEIIHPAIRKEMVNQRDYFVARGEACVVLDIPLLYESGLTHFVEKVIVVAVNPDMQLERILSRDDITEAEAKKRIQSQLPITDKEAKADAVIDNNGTKENSYEQLNKILKIWKIDPT